MMKKEVSSDLGIGLIPKLLIRHAVPSSIGILVMSLNILIDTIFVGQWIGPDAIAAINVVLFSVKMYLPKFGLSTTSILETVDTGVNDNFAFSAKCTVSLLGAF